MNTTISPLRQRMIEDMTIRNLSPATQRTYLQAVSKFSRFSGRSPDRLGVQDVRAFQLHLVAEGISWPSLNQKVCALRFFHGVTLGRAEIPKLIAYARAPRKPPEVLSAEEVVRFREAVPGLKMRTALTAAYAAGHALRRADPQQCAILERLRGRSGIRCGRGRDILTGIKPHDLAGLDLQIFLRRIERGFRGGRGDKHGEHRRGLLPLEFGIVIKIKREQLDHGRGESPASAGAIAPRRTHR
jgi:integrase